MWITIGARDSQLSKNQVIELFGELGEVAPHVRLNPYYLKTIGDRDLKTPLKVMDKTDFFTRDIEEAQLKHKCRISLHSAKDLPEELRKGLKVIAITKGVSKRDVLLLKTKKPKTIATSSERREAAVKTLYPNVACVEVRGGVPERIKRWQDGEWDGLVVAEAALLRLNMHFPVIALPGEPAPLQGQLAVVGWSWDKEMETLFAPLDTR